MLFQPDPYLLGAIAVVLWGVLYWLVNDPKGFIALLKLIMRLMRGQKPVEKPPKPKRRRRRYVTYVFKIEH